jgi:hypothetical protein
MLTLNKPSLYDKKREIFQSTTRTLVQTSKMKIE